MASIDSIIHDLEEAAASIDDALRDLMEYDDGDGEDENVHKVWRDVNDPLIVLLEEILGPHSMVGVDNVENEVYRAIDRIRAWKSQAEG